MLAVLCPAATVRSQGRPTGDGRIWAEIGIGGAQQVGREGIAGIGGASLTGSAGVTVARGFGVAVLVRGFQQLGFETSMNSQYAVALAQFSPRAAPVVSLNVGGGWGRHTVDDFPRVREAGGVVYAGAGLRLPPQGSLALSLTGDVMQSFSGTPGSSPRLISVGVAIGAATAQPPAP